MSIETLNSAARAAGFAMAMSDEPVEETKTEEKPASWRPGEAILLDQAETTAKAAASFAERVKGVFGVLARRAPA